MDELQMLQTQTKKLGTLLTDDHRRVVEQAVMLWGVRLYRKTAETANTLERQLVWLETHNDHPKQGERFAEWERLLRWYETACQELAHAGALLTTRPDWSAQEAA